MAVLRACDIFNPNDPWGEKSQYSYTHIAPAKVQAWPIGGECPITEAMLSHDAFNVAVDALVDIWVLRFGHSWVNLDDIERDEFFKMAYVRLKSLGKVEVHYLTDRSKYVCRKPE